jgi:hypothetical protein
VAKAMLTVPAGTSAGPFDASAPLVSCVANYYQTDAISRASTTMASCTQAFVK